MKDLKKTAVNVWNTAKYIYKNPSVIADMASQNWQEFKNASLEDKVKMITKTGLSIMPAGKVLSANKLANVASKVGKITDKLNDISKGSSKLAKAIKYTNKVRKTAQSTVKKGKSELKSIKNAVLGKTKSSGGVSIVDNKIVNNVNSKGEKVLDLPGNLKEAKCFVAGTKVSSENGLKPIEKVKIGDKVWSKNEETGEVALKKVKNIFVNKTKVLVHVIINGEEIKTTAKHPFYVEEKGWVVASKLSYGDIVIRQDGSKVKVESVETEKLKEEIEVYNFEVEDFHTYFVGENRILVHNTCGVKPVDGVDKVVEGATQAEVSQMSRKEAFRQAKQDASIPKSSQYKTHKYVYDGTSENRTVYEFTVDGKKKYIIEHAEDKMGRGPHFHGADDVKGNPFEKGRNNQYDGHYPEDFNGYKK